MLPEAIYVLLTMWARLSGLPRNVTTISSDNFGRSFDVTTNEEGDYVLIVDIDASKRVQAQETLSRTEQEAAQMVRRIKGLTGTEDEEQLAILADAEKRFAELEKEMADLRKIVAPKYERYVIKPDLSNLHFELRD